MKSSRLFALIAALVLSVASRAEKIDPAVQARIDAKITEITTWASDPVIVTAVKEHNAALPADQAAITQERWRALTVLDPLVRGFVKNSVGQFLKAHKDSVVAEAFVSDAAGLKVGFGAKTTNWSHKGKPKHEIPMTGQHWQGDIEVDESSGQQQVQVAVPIIDGGKPIGSLVVGLSLSGLRP
jgi:hypothetical protein